ncbi:hypothetical protein ACFOMF_08975 [Stutzerimonas tarimensis]|uniref:Uncharacterized protein n=1 Tax=Stutzerimonas tarimensis TaxID=1507735 RepID=A0ABV7T4R5_9GAMM
MSVAFTILLMILGWIAAAAALLWGMLRIARHRPAVARAERAPRPPRLAFKVRRLVVTFSERQAILRR